jgi:hypothetical protein
MAVLTLAQLLELRQAVVADPATTVVPWTKAQINAAVQAIEDWFEAQRTTVAGLIETAAPGVFTNAQKKRIVKYYLQQKFGRE